MGEPLSSETALADTWAAPLLDDTTLDGRKTIRPPEDTVDETRLPRIDLDADDGDFEVRGALGEGGMAVVDRAWQRSLGREVAIKHAREGASGRREAMAREARVAGRLEHPNIVPVHALGRDASGELIIVMKRVSGVSWRALLEQPAHPLWGDGDRLLRNLEILLAVCRAIELAHDRGWLHRDLKTENVMIGEFGEVYVLDWGIAVPLDVAATGDVTFAGTPAYMAPEMVAAGVLGPTTDVFLLGAMLHEALTGQALNEAPSLRAILDAALTPRVRRYPETVPAELAAIATRATAYHAADRYESVAALRRAIAGFVVHRDALAIAERAKAELERAEAGDVDDVRGALVEARSAFRQSLVVWPEGGAANDGLRRTLRALVELELSEDHPAAAAGWAAQLDPRDPELDARVEARRRALDSAAQELVELRDFAAERDVEQSGAIRARRAVAYGIFVWLLGFGVGAAMRAGWFELGYLELGLVHTVSGVGVAAIVAADYRRVNLAARWLASVMGAAAVVPFVVLAAAWSLDLPAWAALPLDFLVWSGGGVVLAVVVQRLFWVAVAFSVGTAAALLAFPSDYALEIAAGGLGLATVLVGARHRLPSTGV